MEKNNEQVKNIWKPLCLVMAELLALSWVFFGFLYSNGNISFDLKAEQPNMTAGSGAIIGESVGNGVIVKTAKIPVSEFAAYGVSPLAEAAYTLTATITPSNATNKALDWSVSFVNPESEWASGKTVTDYVTVTPTSNGALAAIAACLKQFGTPESTAAQFMENLPPEEVESWRKRRQRRRRLGIAAVVLVIAVLAGIVVFFYVTNGVAIITVKKTQITIENIPEGMTAEELAKILPTPTVPNTV